MGKESSLPNLVVLVDEKKITSSIMSFRCPLEGETGNEDLVETHFPECVECDHLRQWALRRGLEDEDSRYLVADFISKTDINRYEPQVLLAIESFILEVYKSQVPKNYKDFDIVLSQIIKNDLPVYLHEIERILRINNLPVFLIAYPTKDFVLPYEEKEIISCLPQTGYFDEYQYILDIAFDEESAAETLRQLGYTGSENLENLEKCGVPIVPPSVALEKGSPESMMLRARLN